MSLVIGTNIVALFSQRSLQQTEAMFNKAMERLSSGKRINSAADDAAGSAIVDRMTSQIKGLNQAVRNANDTISLIKTGEGAMQESAHILQRMRELSVQSASDTNTSADRQYLQKEVSQLQQELTRIAATTEFNQQKILNGQFTAKTFQIGANAGQHLRMSIGDFSADKMGSQRLALNGSANTAVSGASAATITNTVSGAEDLTVAGYLGTTSIDVLNQGTARDVAALVNGVSNTTGVSATAETRTQLDNVSATGTFTLNLYGKNVSNGVNISATISNVADLSNLAEAINARMASTGITAELSADKSKVTMIQAEGYDIVVENLLETGGSGATMDFTGLDEAGSASGAAAALGAAVGTDSGRVAGSVVFASARDYTVRSAASGGLFNNVNANASALNNVAAVDITTQAGANAAIGVLDGALSFVQDERAMLGATQNRLSTTVSNLTNVSSNTEASRSAIWDTDFAKTSSILAKQKILQQAGTAMLVQANQDMQGVLSLLR